MPDAERGDDRRDARGAAQRAVGEPLDQHAEERGAAASRPAASARTAGRRAPRPQKQRNAPTMKTSPWAKLIMRQHAVDHGVAERDQRVDAAELQRVEHSAGVRRRGGVISLPAMNRDRSGRRCIRPACRPGGSLRLRVRDADELAALDLEDHGALDRVAGAFLELHVAGDARRSPGAGPARRAPPRGRAARRS